MERAVRKKEMKDGAPLAQRFRIGDERKDF
jgi:hypothetical protein